MQEAADKVSEQTRKNELLILASTTGFLSEVEQLIAEGASVGCTDKEGTPLLHFPCSKNKLDIVKLLSSKGCDLDSEDKQGRTALHFAANENAHEVVKTLIKSGAWLDGYDINDDTALHLAIRGQHVETVKALVMGGAETGIVNSRGLTALGEAITVKSIEIVELLLTKGADVNRVSKGFSLLHLAAGIGHLSILKLLLQHLSPDKVVHPGGVTPLHCAASRDIPTSVVKLLISHGSDPRTVDKDGRTAFDWAKEDGNVNEETLKLLKVENPSRRGSRRKSTVTEIEPADSPETEWSAFQQMSHKERLKQVEIWARSKEDYLAGLAFLDDDSRRAVAAVGNFMRKLDCQLAIERLKKDEDFQRDALDDEVQKAVAECTENPHNIRKFSSNEKIVGVLIKLKRLQEVLRRNGRMRVVYEDLLGEGDASRTSANPHKEETSVEDLQNSLGVAKEAVIKAVLGGSLLHPTDSVQKVLSAGSAGQKKQEEGANWWNKEAANSSDSVMDTPKFGTWAFTRSVVLQFVRQFLFALLLCIGMVVAMYLTGSLPAPNPQYLRSNEDSQSISYPAHVTDDKSIHNTFQRNHIPNEL